ncbi:MAG: hypothetical protein KAS07_05180 [Candidatus Pacebacteria bacterium]|nr:hypothetical protein [Candidatus Paceibacterota bacterium]
MKWKDLTPLFHRRKRLKPQWKTFVRKILFPGFIMLYFVFTEKSFIESFSNQFAIMEPGEYLFLNSHVALVYVLMPLVFVYETLLFFGAYAYQFSYTFFSIISKTLFTLLTLAALGKILFEIFS